jgi:hypothetical protein
MGLIETAGLPNIHWYLIPGCFISAARKISLCNQGAESGYGHMLPLRFHEMQAIMVNHAIFEEDYVG